MDGIINKACGLDIHKKFLIATILSIFGEKQQLRFERTEEGITERLNYNPVEADKQAAKLLDMAIENFKHRKSSVGPSLKLPMKEAVVGFSTESILEALGGTLDPLLDAIKSGAIKGVVGMVSCTTLRDSGQDVHSVAVVKELIKRNILVLSMGCGN